MPTIFKNDDRKVTRWSDDTGQYKVYDKNDSKIAKLEFNDNGLTDEILLHVLLDRFVNNNKGSGDAKLNRYICDSVQGALLGLTLNKIRRVAEPMKNHGYAELQVDLTSGIKLLNAIVPEVPEGTDLIPLNKLHCTLMYDGRNPELIPEFQNKVYKAKITGIKMLGNPGSRWRAVVLILESETVQNRFKELVEQGFKHSHGDLLTHVSLSYGEDSEVIYPILQKLFEEGKLPETVTLCNETWDQVKD